MRTTNEETKATPEFTEGKPIHLTTNYQFAIVIALTFIGTLATQVNLFTASLMLGIAIVMTMNIAKKLK